MTFSQSPQWDFAWLTEANLAVSLTFSSLVNSSDRRRLLLRSTWRLAERWFRHFIVSVETLSPITEDRSARMGRGKVKAASSSSVNVDFKMSLQSGREERREVVYATLA